jgi:hypothetical protein
MVAACQYLAAEVGFRMLEAGGNAIDAGVAAGVALTVEPSLRSSSLNVATGRWYSRSLSGERHWHANSPDLLRLRRRAEGRTDSRAAEQRDELAPLHYSMTSSAMASTTGGIVRPRALAVLRLMTSSNLVGCSTGISAGCCPFRILSTNSAARR